MNKVCGPVVKDYGTHFLRDDTEIRKSAGCFEDQVEAYSLFCVEPYGRVKVFGGSRKWAIEQADLFIILILEKVENEQNPQVR